MPGWDKIPRRKIEDLITLIDDIIAGDVQNQGEWILQEPSRADLVALRDGLQALLDDRQAKYAAWRDSVALAKDGMRDAIPTVRTAIDKCRAYYGRSNPRLLDYNIAPYRLRTPSEIPTAPEAITAEPAGAGKIKIDWSTVTDAKFYELWRAEEEPQKPGQELHFELVKTLTKTIYTDSGLTSGRRYYYKVRAGNAAGMGEFSAVADCVAP